MTGRIVSKYVRFCGLYAVFLIQEPYFFRLFRKLLLTRSPSQRGHETYQSVIIPSLNDYSRMRWREKAFIACIRTNLRKNWQENVHVLTLRSVFVIQWLSYDCRIDSRAREDPARYKAEENGIAAWNTSEYVNYSSCITLCFIFK